VSERDNREGKLKTDYEKTINQLKEEFLEKENRNMRSFDSEKRSAECNYQEKEKTMSDKIDRLDKQNIELREKKLEYESQIKELTSKLRLLDKQYLGVTTENEKLVDENKSLQRQQYELEKLNAGYFVS
jgi:hypothetical protein